jgi:acyl-CoA hydrolase
MCTYFGPDASHHDLGGGRLDCARMEPRAPSDSHSQLTRWMGIQDANNAGNVHGGVIMKACDEAAGIAAVRHSGRRVVTAGMDRMTFLHPVMVGHLVTFRASVNAAWRTSMEVGVRVEAEDVRSGAVVHTSTAYLTMVALDDEGHPTEVPPIAAQTPDELRREREAQLRRNNRLAERDQIVDERGDLRGGTLPGITPAPPR